MGRRCTDRIPVYKITARTGSHLPGYSPPVSALSGRFTSERSCVADVNITASHRAGEDVRAVDERRGEVPLQGPKLRLQGADPAVVLARGEKIREVGTKVSVGEAQEVSLAMKAEPLGEDGDWGNLARRKLRGHVR